MARGKHKQHRDDPEGRPVEITMTDLEAETEDRPHGARGEDIHAAGTPGGGSAVGGLAGTNVDDGDPDNADLEDALGSGIYDGSDDETEQDEPLAGASGGAVGGTPAGSRASGGNIHRGLAPGGSQHGDSTIDSIQNGGA